MTAYPRYQSIRRRLNSGLIAILIAVSPLTVLDAFAQGEHSRRIAAELAVIAGDLRLLQSKQLSAQHATGLHERIKGGLSGLDILARLADQEQNQPPTSRHTLLKTLRSQLGSGSLSAMEPVIANLIKQYPLELPTIKVKDTTSFKKLHKELCAACHDTPNLNTTRPAYNLSTQTTSTDPVEMFARMLVGVRGDRITGIDNPLSDVQIIGLLTYYQDPE